MKRSILPLLFLCGSLYGQDPAHRERIIGIAPGAYLAYTNFERVTDYLLNDDVLGPRLNQRENIFMERTQPGLNCGVFILFNRVLQVHSDLNIMREHSATVNGSFDLYYMHGELGGRIYAGKNKEQRPFISLGFGYARMQAAITDHAGSESIHFGSAEIPGGETRNFCLDGPSFASGIGFNIINTLQRNNDGSSWKANCMMLTAEAGVNYSLTNEWRSPNGTTATGATSVDPFNCYIRLQFAFGLVTEKDVQNRGE